MNSLSTIRFRQGRPRRRGIVLLIVLVALMVLILSAYTYTELMRTHYIAADLSGRQVQSRFLVDAGVEATRLFLMQTPGVQEESGGHFNNPMYFQARNVLPDVDPERIGSFTVLAPLVDEMGNLAAVRYGLEDESNRLNLNILVIADDLVADGGRTLLSALPGMTDDVADAILDWIDEDDEPRDFGAEYDYYQSLDPPYAPKNGPLDTVEELLLIRGVTPQLLFGQDVNRNGMLDAHEVGPQSAASMADPLGGVSAATTPAVDPIMEGSLDRGWSGYLTLYGQELNANQAGEQRLDLNSEDLETLHADLADTFSPEVANFVIFYRQGNDEYDGQDQGVPASTVAVDLTIAAERSISQVLDLIDARLEVPSPEGGGMIILNPPFPLIGMGAYIDHLMDNATINSNETIPGRLNVNQAPRSLLLGVPGIREEIVEAILSNREMNNRTDNSTQKHEAWLLTYLCCSLQDLKAIQPFICAGGDVFRAQVIGYFEGGSASSRVEIVIERTTATPRIISWRDLSHLGRGYPLEVLGLTYQDPGALSGGVGPAPVRPAIQ